MRAGEKHICDEILRYGTITGDKEFTCEGVMVRQYTISYEGESYDLTKHNGEWVYLHRNIH